MFGLLEDAAMRLIAAGIRAHFAGDHVASVHILVPQVEQTLRLLLEQQGVQTLGGRDRVRQDLLKKMIEKSEGALGRDLAEFLRVWLVDEGSVNLRNGACHALYGDYPDMDGYDPLHELGHGMSLLLILAICLLVGMSTCAGWARNRALAGPAPGAALLAAPVPPLCAAVLSPTAPSCGRCEAKRGGTNRARIGSQRRLATARILRTRALATAPYAKFIYWAGGRRP